MEHPVRKDDTIQIRTTARTRAVLNRAAELRGQKLSEFMLESARRQAEEALLDKRAFFLEPQVYQKFLATLDAPAKPKGMRRNQDKPRQAGRRIVGARNRA